MNNKLSQVFLALAGFAAILIVHRLLRLIVGPCTSPRPPPGPSGLPIIGNVHQVPRSHAWLRWLRWSKTYGHVIYLSLMGQPFVVLNSARAAHELLTRRGAIYSGRPRLVLAGELAMKGMHLLLMPYEARYKLHQRMEAPLLAPRAAASYQPLLDLESRQQLFNMLLQHTSGSKNGGVNSHHESERAMASTTYALMYGRRLLTGQEPELSEVHEIQVEFSAMMVGPNLVDMVPLLNRIPLPWPWRKQAEGHYAKQRRLHVANLRAGLRRPGWNFAKEMAASAEGRQMAGGEEELAFDLGVLADAALETTVISGDWFLVAWLTQDHGGDDDDDGGGGGGGGGGRVSGFVAEAQARLDEVVGRGRLPDFEDRPRLPYIDAIVEEVLRWRPIGAAGVPHVTNVEDMYEGFRIPAGSIVTANQWAITRDVEVFGEDADEFRPERWLVGGQSGRQGVDEGEKEAAAKPKSEGACPLRDLPTIGFGFGRRICTGRHIARHALWIQIARLLWAFDLEGAVSPETGEEVHIDPSPLAATDSLVIRPLPFKILIKPRGLWVEEVIRSKCDTTSEDFVELLDKIGEDRASKH